MSTLGCVPPEELEGFGTLLQYQDPQTGEWITVAGTQDLETPEDTDDDAIEGSPDPISGYKRFLPSRLRQLNALSFEWRFRKSVYAVMRSFRQSRRPVNWRMVFMTPEQDYFQFCAWVSSLQRRAPERGGLVVAVVGLQPTGAPIEGALL